MSPEVARYREAARRHDAEPPGPGRIVTMADLLRAALDLTDAELHQEQVAAWERWRRATMRR